MHELHYEPLGEGVADGRRLARWLAAGTLGVFGMLGVTSMLEVCAAALEYGIEETASAIADGELVLTYVISGLAAPLALAASAAWLVTGRVVVVLVAGCPFTGAAAGAFNTFRFVTDYGMDWSLLAWLPLGVGYFLLGLLFLTQTFRCAVNATRAHSIRLPRPASGS